MKKISILLGGLLATSFTIAQPQSTLNSTPGKLKLEAGQKIIAESSTTIQGDFGMGMEMNSSSVQFNTLQVISSINDNYSITNTLTKMKVDFSMMGQNNSYDSEDKNKSNDELSGALGEKINKPVEVTIDSRTGLAVKKEEEKNKKNDDDISNPAAGLLDVFGDASDDAVVSAAFEVIPRGKLVGESWADTTKKKDFQEIRTYTLKSLDGDHAVLEVTTVTNAINKMEFQGTEFEIKTNATTKAEIITNKNTGIVKERKSTTDVTGSFQLMGQDMPISATVKTNSIYK